MQSNIKDTAPGQKAVPDQQQQASGEGQSVALEDDCKHMKYHHAIYEYKKSMQWKIRRKNNNKYDAK